MKRRLVIMDNNSVKIRKSGHSTILTVPKSIKPEADTYNVYQGKDGVIVYIPKHTNPFKDEKIIRKYRNSYQKEEMGGHLLGNEL